MANGSSAKLVLVTTVKMESQVGEVKLSTLSHSQILLCGGGVDVAIETSAMLL